MVSPASPVVKAKMRLQNGGSIQNNQSPRSSLQISEMLHPIRRLEIYSSERNTENIWPAASQALEE
jgi:hypothetical protein